MRIIYIAHPIGGDVEANLADLRRILRIINTNTHPNKVIGETFDFKDVYACAPYYADIVSLDDHNPLERAIGMNHNTEIILSGVFEELWLTGDKVSLGMKEEIKHFILLGKEVRDFIGKI